MALDTLKEVFGEINEESILPQRLFEKLLAYPEAKLLDLVDDEKFYQPIYIGFDDFDKRHDSSMDKPVYYNDFDFNVQEEREKVVSMLRTEYQQNTFSTVASCACGAHKGNYYAGTDFICPEPECGTPVVKPLSSNFTTKVWLKRPAQISGFINPAIYSILLLSLITKSPKIELMRFWIDKKERAAGIKLLRSKNPKLLQQIEDFRASLGIEYGYNSFVENIDDIVMNLLNTKILNANIQKREELAEFWMRYKDRAISNYFPVPNKIMTIVETDKRSKYYAKEQLEVSLQFQTIADLFDEDDARAAKNEELLAPVYHKLVDALNVLREVTMFGKYGGIRHSAGSGRLPFTGRTIISGESGVCRTDTVILPWIFVSTILDKHLLSWLYRRGYTPIKAREVIVNASRTICPIVEEFVSWIEDNHYMMVTAGRQPSIVYLSARTMFARFNRDINDLSMRIPITTTKPYGADYDGDQMYVRLVTDLDAKIKSYSNWGHQISLSPNELFKPGPFCFQTKSNLLNINSLLLNTPVKKLYVGPDGEIVE